MSTEVSARGRARDASASVVGFVAAVVVFFTTTKGPVFHARVDRGSLGGGDFIDDPWTQSVFALAYVLAIAAFFLHRSVAVPRWVAGWMVAPSLALLAAAAWSPYPERALEQASMMFLGTLAALAVGAMMRPRLLLWSVWTAMGAGLVMSFWADRRDWIFSRDIDGNVVGVYFNSNSFGAVAIMFALTSVLLIGAGLDSRRPAHRWSTVIAGAAGTVIGGVIVAPIAALTPVVGALCSLAAAGTVAALRRNRRGGLGMPPWPVVATGVFVLLALMIGAGIEVRDGRLSTVSDRFEIWTVVSRFIRERPIIGWGLMSAWLENDMSVQIQAYGGRVVKETHNGFLEVLMGGGVIALAALVGAVASGLRAVTRSAVRATSWVSLWPLVAVVYCIVVNLGETYIGANLLPWTVLVAGVAAATRRQAGAPDA